MMAVTVLHRAFDNASLLRENFLSAWTRTDELFGIVKSRAMLTTPIALRHPFIFYVGHLPAFA
ncbi:MAG TPA: hypothetical protein VHM64_11360, partial [Candidatus Binatia bacterium]|nr:hypothetical protein [Candidatus Binatia bacterium]